MTELNKNTRFLDVLGLTLIGLCCSMYAVFSHRFAELHIQLPFLDFPIFVGEILLIACLAILFSKYCSNLPKLTKWHYWIICYFAFVVAKALYGYVIWGPLAFRNAALLYYPVFAIFGYIFYCREVFTEKSMIFPLASIMIIFAIDKFNEHWVLTLFVLGLILINSYSRKAVKFSLLAGLLILVPYKDFFTTSRMMIVANVISGFFIVGLIPLTLRVKKELKILLGALLGSVIIIGMLYISPHKALKSIVDFKGMIKVFQEDERIIENEIQNFRMKERKVTKLYNPGKKKHVSVEKIVFDEDVKTKVRQALVQQVQEKFEAIPLEEIKVDSQKEVIAEVKREMGDVLSKIGEESQTEESVIVKDAVKEATKEVAKETPKETTQLAIEEVIEEEKIKIQGLLYKQTKREIQSFSVSSINDQDISPQLIVEVKEELQYDLKKEFEKEIVVENPEEWRSNNNAVFRIFIWRDLLVQLINEKPIVGFDFGKPFRSISLEVLNWGTGDWTRDGWIGIHNSYLHIIYRAGIMGILFILSIFIILFKMIKRFICQKSFIGVLLCSIIVNWFVAANFLLIFELPYTAIPIWTIFGMTFGFYCNKKNEREAIL